MGNTTLSMFKIKKQLEETCRCLANKLTEFIKIGDWYVRKRDIRGYKRMADDLRQLYRIDFEIPYLSDMKLKFDSKEDLDKRLGELDKQFGVK